MIAAGMQSLLEGAAFGGHAIDERGAGRLIERGQSLLEKVREAARGGH